MIQIVAVVENMTSPVVPLAVMTVMELITETFKLVSSSRKIRTRKLFEHGLVSAVVSTLVLRTECQGFDPQLRRTIEQGTPHMSCSKYWFTPRILMGSNKNVVSRVIDNTYINMKNFHNWS